MAEKTKQTGDAGAGAAAPTTLSKKEAVRRALKELGKDATPSAMRPWIKQQFGIEMSNDHISTAKGEILRGKGKKKSHAKATTPARQPAKPTASVASRPRPAAGTISLDDVRLVKELLARISPAALRGLI